MIKHMTLILIESSTNADLKRLLILIEEYAQLINLGLGDIFINTEIYIFFKLIRVLCRDVNLL